MSSSSSPKSAQKAKKTSTKKSTKAKPRVVALSEQWERIGRPSDPLSEWASLVGDLTAPSEDRVPEWRIHDRTHLEFSVDYRLDDDKRVDEFTWDAYFFIPESLRLNKETYQKYRIYEDLQSYVRFAVPPTALRDLIGDPLARVNEALSYSGREADKIAIREMRLFACQVRASGLSARRTISDMLIDDPETTTIDVSARELVRRAGEVTIALRAVLAQTEDRSEEVRLAAEWVDEDISRVLETIFASLAIELRATRKRSDDREETAGIVAFGAVTEARYRRDNELDEVGHADAGRREIEHLEFRRHVLKRFTSSVLWLSLDYRDAAKWISEALYAIAACVAMSFAVLAAAFHGPQWGNPEFNNDIWMWAVIVVLAYAGKDRIKATLQGTFSEWVAHRFPDRRWHLRDKERAREVGRVKERSSFLKPKTVPEDVWSVRNTSRRVDLEEQARPEQVLWHQKQVRLKPSEVAVADERFHALTEIFRLDLRRWLVHTDDPKQRIVFADPDDERIYSATAPRVYNIGVVYRLTKNGEPAEWHRVRVVVTRKGIERIDQLG